MAVSIWFQVTQVATVINIGLLLVLTYIWLRNYVDLQSKLTLGLSIFAVLMLAHNVLALYFYRIHSDLSQWYADIPELPHLALMVLAVLQLGALIFLTWVTWE